MWYSNARASGWESGKIIDVFMVTIELTNQDIAALNRGNDITIPVEMTKTNALGEVSAYISEEYSGEQVNIKNGSVTHLGVENDDFYMDDDDDDSYLLGDVDGDGVISPIDAYDVLLAYANVSLTGNTDYSAWFSSFNELAADVDGDGSIVPNDAYYILTYYANEQLGLYPTWEEIIH